MADTVSVQDVKAKIKNLPDPSISAEILAVWQNLNLPTPLIRTQEVEGRNSTFWSTIDVEQPNGQPQTYLLFRDPQNQGGVLAMTPEQRDALSDSTIGQAIRKRDAAVKGQQQDIRVSNAELIDKAKEVYAREHLLPKGAYDELEKEARETVGNDPKNIRERVFENPSVRLLFTGRVMRQIEATISQEPKPDPLVEAVKAWGAEARASVGTVSAADFKAMQDDGALRVEVIKLKPEYDKVAPPSVPPKPEAPKREAGVGLSMIEEMRAAVEANRAASQAQYERNQAEIKASGDVLTPPQEELEPLVFDTEPKNIRELMEKHGLYLPDVPAPGAELSEADVLQLHRAAKTFLFNAQLPDDDIDNPVFPQKEGAVDEFLAEFEKLNPDLGALLREAKASADFMSAERGELRASGRMETGSVSHRSLQSLERILYSLQDRMEQPVEGYEQKLKAAMEAHEKKFALADDKWPSRAAARTLEGREKLFGIAEKLMDKIFALKDSDGNALDPRGTGHENEINDEMHSLKRYDIGDGTTLGDFIQQKVWFKHNEKGTLSKPWSAEEMQGLRDQLEQKMQVAIGNAPPAPVQNDVAPVAPPPGMGR